MPMGLSTAPCIIPAVDGEIVGWVGGVHSSVYLDDVMVFSREEEAIPRGRA